MSLNRPGTDQRVQEDPLPHVQVRRVRPASGQQQPRAGPRSTPHADATETTAEPAARGDADDATGQPQHHQQCLGDAQASPRPLTLRVLGRFQLIYDDGGGRDLSGALTPKQREVLVYLALRPQGVRREALNDAIWPDSRPPRRFNSLHNALSRLRRALNTATNGTITDLVLNDDGRYHLNTELVTTDYEQFHRAIDTPRSAGDHLALDHLRDSIDLYQGELAEDLTSPWIEPFRESIRRDMLDALGVLIRAHGKRDSKTMLMLLERTRRLDRYNESVYRDIIRTQASLGQYDAVQRTLTLLETTLAEIDEQPSTETRELVTFLHSRTAPNSAAAG